METNYYESELQKVSAHSTYARTIKIKGAAGEETKWIDLNNESANELVKWLKNSFVIED